tara:strand:+ start:2192 stop:2392 length:201 start_codon:yes stop_codon:yes gene_type:complete
MSKNKIKGKISEWIKSPKNIYLLILLVAVVIYGIINNSLLIVLIVLGLFVCYGIVWGLIFSFRKKS